MGRRPGRGFSTRSTRCTRRCGAAAARPTWESSPRYALGRPFHSEGPPNIARANRRAPRGSAGGRRSGEGQGQAKSPPRRRMRLGFGPPCMMSGPQTCMMWRCAELTRFDARGACECWNERVARVIAVMRICGSSRGSLGHRRNRVARMASERSLHLCGERAGVILGEQSLRDRDASPDPAPLF